MNGDNVSMNASMTEPTDDLLMLRMEGALRACLRVFEAWQNDANPNHDLKRGESADYDAACDMANRIRNVLKDIP